MTLHLTWNEAERRMNEGGYVFRISRGVGNAVSWASKHHDEPAVESNFNDPVMALNELLERCETRWPTPDPLDEMNLDQLLVLAARKGWSPSIHFANGSWQATANLGSFWHSGDTPITAMRKAVKGALDRDKTAPSDAETVRPFVVRGIQTTCASCGSTDRLQIHHLDSDQTNNDPSNLMTLCVSCHTKWHWTHGKKPSSQPLACSVCGKRADGLGFCEKHRLRFKKYGDPYLTKIRDGSRYVLVRETPSTPNGLKPQE